MRSTSGSKTQRAWRHRRGARRAPSASSRLLLALATAAWALSLLATPDTVGAFACAVGALQDGTTADAPAAQEPAVAAEARGGVQGSEALEALVLADAKSLSHDFTLNASSSADPAARHDGDDDVPRGGTTTTTPRRDAGEPTWEDDGVRVEAYELARYPAARTRNVRFIDPLIGTLSPLDAKAAPGGAGGAAAANADAFSATPPPRPAALDPDSYAGLTPTPAPPFAGVRWTAVTRKDYVDPARQEQGGAGASEAYYYGDGTFHGHQGSAKPAIWMGSYNHVALSAGVGARVRVAFGDRALPLEHDGGEFASAYKHAARLDASAMLLEGEGASDGGAGGEAEGGGATTTKGEARGGARIYAELTGGNHTSFARYSFSEAALRRRDGAAAATTTTTAGSADVGAAGEVGPYVVMHASRDGWRGAVYIDRGRREISGWTTERQDYKLGPHEARNFRSYFVSRFDADFGDDVGTAKSHDDANATLFAGQLARWNDANVSAYVRFAPGTRQVGVRTGQSMISIEQARYNLDVEMGDGTTFEDAADRVLDAWDAYASRLELEGTTDARRRSMYTAMFRALQLPSLHSEPVPPAACARSDAGDAQSRDACAAAAAAAAAASSGRHDHHHYSFTTDSVRAGEAYQGYSTWDTWRAAWAMQILLAPERVGAMVASMLDFYATSGPSATPGYLPMWLNGGETNIMISTWADMMVAEALAKNVTGFDAALAWEAVRRDSDVPPERDEELRYADREEFTPLEARAGLTWYAAASDDDDDEDDGGEGGRGGWVPHDRTDESVSRTLDYATCDWAASVVARLAAGDEASARRYESRSRSAYRRVFDRETGFFVPRLENGSFVRSTLPSPRAREPGYTEGNRWTWAFSAVHDVAGLAELHGGRDALVAKLDEYFGDAGYADHGNEPEHHVPSLYALLGKPARTQEVVRDVVRDDYRDTPYGLVGNDDAGQMSAWLWFQALGLYPVNPASATYVVGSPHFERATLRLSNGRTWRLTAPGASQPQNKYVASLRLPDADAGGEAERGLSGRGRAGSDSDANKVSRDVFQARRGSVVVTHDEVMRGGEWRFEMSDEPQEWGSY